MSQAGVLAFLKRARRNSDKYFSAQELEILGISRTALNNNLKQLAKYEELIETQERFNNKNKPYKVYRFRSD